MSKIIEVSIKKKVNCSKDVAFWNYWDHEHLDVVHKGYKKSDIMYDSKNFLFRFLCDLGNCIPVKRATSDRVALLKVIKLLKKENLCGLFPEGQRSRDGKIGQAKLGVAIMALKSGSPIVPLAIKGTFEAFPRKTKFIKPATVILKFGTPLQYAVEKKPSKERINEVRDEIMNRIQKLYDEIN